MSFRERNDKSTYPARQVKGKTVQAKMSPDATELEAGIENTGQISQGFQLSMKTPSNPKIIRYQSQNQKLISKNSKTNFHEQTPNG